MKDPEPRIFEEDISQEQIEVHWQHPRTELELPLLLVWPNPMIDEWAATIENGTATVVCHEWLVDAGEDDETEIEKRAEEWGAEEKIPTYIAEALLRYDGEYGPVERVANPHPSVDADDTDPTVTCGYCSHEFEPSDNSRRGACPMCRSTKRESEEETA